MVSATEPATRPARPGSVTLACWLLYLVALLHLAGAVVSLVYMNRIATAAKEAFPQYDNTDRLQAFTKAGLVTGMVSAVVLALGLMFLASLNAKGRNGARVTTWIFSILGVLATAYNARGVLFNGSLPFGLDPSKADKPDPVEVAKAIKAAMPSWYYPATLWSSVVEMVALILVILLLLTPAAHAFFRRGSGRA